MIGRKVLDKVFTVFKGIVLFCILYILLSWNGEDSFWGVVLSFAALVLTILFLDEAIDKVKLTITTIVLSVICHDGFLHALPFLIIWGGVVLFYFIVVCKKDRNRFYDSISAFHKRDSTEYGEQPYSSGQDNICHTSVKHWSAINMLHPFERYHYDEEKKRIVIKNWFPPLIGNEDRYPIAAFVNTDMMKKKYRIFCDMIIPVLYSESPHKLTEVKLKNIRRKKSRELERLLAGE